jgi:type I restriction enzyme, S subunit
LFELTPVGDLCTDVTRGISPSYADQGVVVLSQKCVRENRISYDAARFMNPVLKKIPPKKMLKRFDVLVNSTGVGTLGRVAQIKSIPTDTTVDSHVSIVRPDPKKIDPVFFGFAMIQNQKKIESMGEGATGQTELSRTRLSQEILIPCPAVSIQRRIAGILSAYDDLIENCQRRIRILETMARSLYREWFVHFRFPGHENHPRVHSPLGEIPKGWEVKSIASLSAYVNRGLAPTYHENGEFLILNQKCIRDQRLNFEPARRQSKTIPIEKTIRFGDVLINSTGVGTLGRVAQLYQEIENCTVDSHVTIVRPNDFIDFDFFGMSLMERQETFERLGVGATGQTELNRTSVANVDFPVPPREIAERFGQMVRPMRKSIVLLTEKIKNLHRTRDLLLPRLLSGQIELKTN